MEAPIFKRLMASGHVSIPVIMQMEETECGAACLAMILAYYDCWIPMEEIRLDCGVSRNGSSAKNIVHTARKHGLDAWGFRYEPDELREEGIFPCIIHWNFHHFVVLNGFKGKKAVITDPAKGVYTVSEEMFDRCFTGVCLFFEPGKDFERKGNRRNIWSYAAKRLSGARSAVIFVLLTTLITSVIGLVNPAFQRFFIDRLLAGGRQDWLIPFLAVVFAFAAMQILVSWISIVFLTQVKGQLATTASAGYMWHVMHLPMDFFSQRQAGSIDKRKQTNEEIGYDLLVNIVPLAVNTLMIIVYLGVMVRYNLYLTLTGILGIVINVLASRNISGKNNDITRVQYKEENHLAGITVSGFEMIEAIKSNGSEDAFFEKWANLQAVIVNEGQKSTRLNAYLGIIPSMITASVNAFILTVGVCLTIRGEFTPGMILAFQGLMNAVAEPVSSMLNASQSIFELQTNVEQVEDVLAYPEDRRYTKDSLDKDEEYDKLRGEVELKDVTFGYSPMDAPVIKHFNLSVKPGKSVAIVGPSGCGKSTVAKLLSGLYQPWSGEALYDGKTIDEIDHSVFTGSFAVVNQEITLFKDTVANNIKMWDRSIEDFEMILAAKDAQIHDDIMQREGGYQFMVEEGGRNLSGGQRQCLEIARVLAQDPTIVILDEATSAMDAQTEYEVLKAIQNRGVTCIAITHRLSMIRDFDEIVVLNYGEIVERGTHDELLAKEGYYSRLVRSAEGTRGITSPRC